MKRKEFTVVMGYGSQAVSGWALTEHFGAHRPRRDWMLTHIPSGLAAFPSGFRTRGDCKGVAEFLEKSVPTSASWDFADQNGYTETHQEVMKAARNHTTYDSKYCRYEWVG